ncbi:MAG: hypothetical protein AAGF10_07970, partial [Verrucomicrobiota bacterium]
MKFAKIFESPTYGQILLKLDVDDEGKHELRYYCHPDNAGVCSFALGFDDTDEGHEKARLGFDRIKQQDAE